MSLGPIQRHSLISFLSLISLTAIGYVSTMYFAHVLGPAILGSFFIFLAYYGVFDLVGDGGFGGAAAKRISEGKEQNQYFSAFIVLRIVLMAITILLLFVLEPFFTDLSSSGLFLWLVLAIIVGTFFSIVANGMYGTGKVGVAQISSFLNNVVKLIVQVLAIILGFAAGGLAGGFIAGMIVGLLINFSYLELSVAKFNSGHLKNLFSFSFWSFLASGGVMVFSYADTILIGYFLTNADVGIYRVALQLTGAAAFITGSLHYVLFPKISQWHAEGKITMVEATLSRAFTYSLFLAVPVVAGGFVLGDRLLYFFYGSVFETGTYALMVLLIVQVVNIFMFLQTMCLNAMDRPKHSFVVTAIAASLNIVLNIALIPVLGIVGAAVATLISITVNAALSYRYLSFMMRVSLESRPVSNIIAASIIMALVILGIRLIFGIDTVISLAITLSIGGVLYFLILFRLDRGIRNEIGTLLSSLGIPMPEII